MRHIEERTVFQWKKEESKFEKKDYRSKLYSGDWTRAWITYCADNAIMKNKDIYEIMWEQGEQKHEHFPSVLFKFYPFNQNSLKCIDNNAIYVNSPNFFNDPYDCSIHSSIEKFVKRYLLNYIEANRWIDNNKISLEDYEILRDSDCNERIIYSSSEYLSSPFRRIITRIYLENSDLGNEIYNIMLEAEKKYKKAIEEISNQHIRVASFSELSLIQMKSFIEMWGHYADSHKGFCVEYDISKGINDKIMNNVVLGSLLPCKYSSKPIQIADSLIYKYVNEIEFTEKQKVQFEKSVISSFIQKSSSWSYEKEWRLLVPEKFSSLYDNMISFFPIKSIYTGCRISVDDKEYLFRIAQRKGIDVYELQMQDRGYMLEDTSVDVEEYFKRKRFFRGVGLKKSEYEMFDDEAYNLIRNL